jgi:sortase A
VERILVALAERRRARQGVTAVAVALVVAALGMLSYPVITDFYHDSLQGQLAREFASPATRQAYLDGDVQTGRSLTRIEIPKLGVDVVVVQGDDDKSLEAGVGHYPETPMPCEEGDVAIAGHRTTYGKPFANVDRLSPGDQIVLQTPVGACIYVVAAAPFVVLPNDWQAVAPAPGQFELTLTACDPKGSASHRIVVKALMISSSTTL